MVIMIVDIVLVDLCGIVYGMFNLVSGLVMLGVSVLVGLLWDKLGVVVMFYVGVVFCVLVLGLLVI